MSEKKPRGRPKTNAPKIVRHKAPHMYERRFVAGETKEEALKSYNVNEPRWKIEFEKSSYAEDGKRERARVKKAYYRKQKSAVPKKPKRLEAWQRAKKADGTSYKSKETYDRALEAKKTREKKRAMKTKKAKK